MEPIVHGLRRKYGACLTLERVNFHERTSWHEILAPLGSPEFALIGSTNEIIHRWFGYTEEVEFAEILDPYCRS